MTLHLKNIANEDVGVPSAFGFTAATRRSATFYEQYGKRLFDLCFVLLSAPIVLPLTLILALAVLRDGAAPFYWQKRLGRNGKTFKLLKLRTMVPDADKIFQEYLDANPEARREWDLTQKLKNDPRVTLVGRLLRKTSMDELPQFWNVLRGEMSLVGPRPMMVDQAPLYPGKAYYKIRPGITGLWQVKDRNNTSFMARAGYDTQYYRAISLISDCAILLRTILVVVRGTGY
ncbi:sugar transferase [Maritimibacter sp. 55A14]|uniref:sugar transferase n=1 Tax=Maritimibacter sp. 55A14 TaxID=2174844 RepID=UPI001E581EAA|nr:sugar transferase [Maritimibacter sp. 55A14]